MNTANPKPKARAMGEVINGVRQTPASIIKIIFRIVVSGAKFFILRTFTAPKFRNLLLQSKLYFIILNNFKLYPDNEKRQCFYFDSLRFYSANLKKSFINSDCSPLGRIKWKFLSILKFLISITVKQLLFNSFKIVLIERKAIQSE